MIWDPMVEDTAVKALAGVGGDFEWWIFSDRGIGHLRVPVTEEEYLSCPPGPVIATAGETGPKRPRTILAPCGFDGQPGPVNPS